MVRFNGSLNPHFGRNISAVWRSRYRTVRLSMTVLVRWRYQSQGIHIYGFWRSKCFNPRPDTVFRHLRSDRGLGLVRPPLGVSKRSVVELHGKDQQIALAEYSRLVVLFLALGLYLNQLWQVKGQIFGNYMNVQLNEYIAAKLSIVAAWNLHQRVPRSILHRMGFFDASRLNI